MYLDDTAMGEDTYGNSLAHLCMSFVSVFSKQASVFLLCLWLFLGKSEKNILVFPSLGFHTPSKEREGKDEDGNFANGCAK
jgi:hypothetical protein